MHQAEIIVALFTIVSVAVLVARKLGLPYPIVLVLVGLTLSFVPRLPRVNLNADIVFYFFLPPLIYPAALFTSWRDFRRNLQPILLLAVGLVLFTMLIVAWVVHSVLGILPWASAFALGAIVSPPDAVAATSVIRRLPVPHRLAAILEGESLANDATALVALQFAVAAVLTGNFSVGHASLQFVWTIIAGVGFGLLIGFIIRWVHVHLDDPPVQITISLLTPFLAYLPAEALHFSGILATATAGIYLGWHSPLIVRARYRLQAFAFWEIVVFLLNGFIFIAIGLQLPAILHTIGSDSINAFIGEAAAISAAVVLVRIVWVFLGSYFPALVIRRTRHSNPFPRWQDVAILAWSGMRGVVSLAAAFALPFTLPNGLPFPGRDYILFFTFCVILTTLVFQGLTLPALIGLLRIEGDRTTDQEERSARLEANKAALDTLRQLLENNEFPLDLVERLRLEYDERIEQLELCAVSPNDCSGQVATPRYQQLKQQALDVERKTIIHLRNQNVINDEALRRIQRDLDLAEARLTG